MPLPAEIKYDSAENRFLYLYKTARGREDYLGEEAQIAQYSALLRFFMRFLQQKDRHSAKVYEALRRIYTKLGDIYYQDALQNQDNSKYFQAAEYYNQSLAYARNAEEKRHILLLLKDIYYYLNDDDAYVRVEETWAENHEKEDKFAAYMILAQNEETPQIKAQFLEKALNEIMSQDGSFYAKYQNTLDICSQLAAIYELQGEKEKALRVKKLREQTLKLLN